MLTLTAASLSMLTGYVLLYHALTRSREQQANQRIEAWTEQWFNAVYGDGALPNARVLGVNEGTLSYCGARDPAAAARLRQKIERLVQGASAQQLAEVRNSDEYRKAYVEYLVTRLEAPRAFVEEAIRARSLHL